MNKDISYRDTVITELRYIIKDLVEKHPCYWKNSKETKEIREIWESKYGQAESCHCETCLANYALATTSGWE